MKDRAIVERDAVFLGMTDRVRPILGPVRQADEIRDPDGRFVRKQFASELAGRGVDDGGLRPGWEGECDEHREKSKFAHEQLLWIVVER
jgi:hypothetical protein